MAIVVTSVPMAGPSETVGRDCAEAASLALEDAGGTVEHLVLDAGAGFLGRHVEPNARRAASDAGVVGYLGELHSAASEVSLPILEAAGVPHVSFSNTLRRLVGTSFVNVMPNDERQAVALVDWMRELGVERPYLLDDAEDYGIDMRWLVHAALAAAGVPVAGAGRVEEGDGPPEELAGSDGVFLGGVAGPRAERILATAAHLAGDALLFGMEGLYHGAFAAALPAPVAGRLHVTSGPLTRGALPPQGRDVVDRLSQRLRREPDQHAIYAYEAMSLLLTAIEAAGADRAAVVRALRATRDRQSVLGPYSIDDRGQSTLTAAGRLRIEDRRFRPAAEPNGAASTGGSH